VYSTQETGSVVEMGRLRRPLFSHHQTIPYWHLSLGDESEAAGPLDAYLERVSPTGAIVRVGND
jgi:hypothetical protein